MLDYKRISFEERKKIYFYLEVKENIAGIAKKLGRHRTAIYREIKRNSEFGKYIGSIAQDKAQARCKVGRRNKIRDNPRLQKYIFKYLKAGWSPEQIAGRLKRFKVSYYVSHESIYRYIYGEKRKEWYKYLLYKRPRRHKHYSRNSLVRYSGGKSIHIRDKEVRTRKEFGHWEGDTVAFGTSRLANITTLVERKTLYTHLLKNDGKTSEEVMGKIKNFMLNRPKKFWKTITFDQGAEFANFREIERWIKCMVYYCDAHAPWQKGSNENTNGRLRRYLPRSTDINNLSVGEIMNICEKMNTTPRKKLGYLMPKEALALEFKSCCRT